MNPLSLDDWMDRAIVPGYTRIGYRLRANAWDTAVAGDLSGRVALVTGASAGLGEAACEGLARAGATVHMLVRDRERGERARERIAARLSADPKFRDGERGELLLELCDLSDLGAVRDFAHRFRARHPSLHVLVNNAGVMPEARKRTGDGLELAFATNVIAPFLLTGLLMAALGHESPGRVITVSSGGMYSSRLHGADVQLDGRDFSGGAFYAHTKRAQVILTEMAAQRCAAQGVVFAAMHPGWADTPGVQGSMPGFHRLMKPLLRDPRQGADTIVWLATAAAATTRSGAFWHDRRERPRHRVPWTRETGADRERLWSQCVAYSGLER